MFPRKRRSDNLNVIQPFITTVGNTEVRNRICCIFLHHNAHIWSCLSRQAPEFPEISEQSSKGSKIAIGIRIYDPMTKVSSFLQHRKLWTWRWLWTVFFFCEHYEQLYWVLNEGRHFVFSIVPQSLSCSLPGSNSAPRYRRVPIVIAVAFRVIAVSAFQWILSACEFIHVSPRMVKVKQSPSLTRKVAQ